MAQSPATDTMHPAGKLPPTLTPTGHFSGKPTLPISRSVTLIGSRKQARLQLISSTVSQNHSLIINADSGPYIRDLASREHTLVNGIPVTEGALSDGDEIQIGRFTFRFNESPQTQPAEAIRKIRPAPVGRVELDGQAGGGGGAEVGFEGKSLLIGRRDTCDVALPEDSVSTTHAIIFEMDGRRYIRDLASRTGTFVNGKQIHQVEIAPGDRIRIGSSTMRYAAEDGAAEETFAPPVPIPADLGADAGGLGDLELDTQESDLMPLAPAPQPRSAQRATQPVAAAPPRPAPAGAASAGADALELVQDQPEALEPVELAPADLEASKHEADAAPGAAAGAAASQGELSIEHLDIDDPATEEISVDDLLGLEPASGEGETPADAAAGPVELADDTAEPLEAEPLEVQSVEAEAGVADDAAPEGGVEPAVDDEIALSPLEVSADPGAAPVAAHDAGDEDQLERDLALGAPAPSPDETVDATALGLHEVQPPVGLAPQAGETSGRFSPGASQLDLAPGHDVSAEHEPAAEEAAVDPLAAPAEAPPAAQAPLELAEDQPQRDAGVQPIIGLAPVAPEPMAREPEPAAAQPAAAATPPPLVEAELDQDALSALAAESRATAEAGEDLAPDETFDTIEARSAKPQMDFAGIDEVTRTPSHADDVPAALAEDFGFAPDLAESLDSPHDADRPAPASLDESSAPVPPAAALPAVAATEPSARESDLDLPPVIPLPKVTADDVQALEFAGADEAEAKAVPAGVFEPFNESAVEVPPLELPRDESSAHEPPEIAPADDGLSVEPIDLPPIADETGAAPIDLDAADAGLPAAGAGSRADLADTIVSEQTPVFDMDDLGGSTAAGGGAGAGSGAGAGLGAAAIAGAVGAAGAAALGAAATPDASAGRTKGKPKRPPRSTKKKPFAPPEPPEEVVPAEATAPPPQHTRPSSKPRVEVLDHTESTPESALPPLPSAEARDGAVAEAGPAQPPEEVALTDTGFGRAIEELAGESKPIVEDRAAPLPHPAPAEPPAPIQPVADLDPSVELEPIEPDLKPQAAGSQAIDDDAALDLLAADESATPAPAAEGELTLEPFAVPATAHATPPVPPEQVAGASDLGDAGRAAAPSPAEVIEVEPSGESASPAEVELEAIDEPPVVSAAAGDDVRDWGLELDDVKPAPDAAAPTLEPPALAAASSYAPGASQLDLEPVDENTVVPPAAADLELEPVAEAPEAAVPIAPPPPIIPEPPTISAPAAAFNWGANQEHFLGGMPLRLGTGPGAQSTPARPLPPAQPRRPESGVPIGGAPAAPVGGGDDILTSTPAPASPATPAGPFASEPAAPARPQPQPRQPQRPQPRPTPRRGPPTPTPFAGGGGAPPADKGRAAPLATGFDGLALPPVRETDVFAPMPGSLTAGFAPGLMDDVFGGNARRPTPNPQPQPGGNATPPVPPTGTLPAAGGGAEPAPRRQPAARRATKAEPPGDSWSSDTSPVAHPGGAETSPAQQQHRPAVGTGAAAPRPPAQPAANEAAPRKKRRWFGLRLFLLILLLPCALAAAWATYQYIPNRSSIRGDLRFANFDDLPTAKRKDLQTEQQRLLGDDKVREVAKVKLLGNAPNLKPGFLADALAFARLRTEAKLNPQSGAFEIPLSGASGRDDQTRMFVLLQAMYDANAESVGRAGRLDLTLKTLTRERADATRQMDDLKRRIDQLGTTAQSAPPATERAALDAEAKKLQSVWAEADLEVTRLAAQIQRLEEEARQQPPPAAADPAPAPSAPAVAAATAAPPSPADDEQLQRLDAALRDLQGRIAALREGKSADHDAVAQARQAFTSALDAFDKSLASAQAVEKGDSPLAPYLVAAQKMLEATRQQSGEFAARQQEQRAKLAQNQAALDEKLAARKAELLKRDPDLARLVDQRDITTRQYNAAVAQNLSREAAEIKTELNLIESMISARKTQIADDGFSADAIDQLQRVVEATRKEMDDDRARTMQSLEQAQAEAAQAAIPADALSPEQRQAAAALEKSLAAVAESRGRYADAMASAAKSADEQVATLTTQSTEFATQAAARRAELEAAAKANPAAPPPPAVPAPAVAAATAPAPDASAEREKTIGQKTTELAAAQQRRAQAEAALSAARAKLLDFDQRLKVARAAGEERDRLIAQRDAAEQDLQQKILHYERRKEEAEIMAYPEIPAESDVKSDEKPDQRPVYSLAAGVGVMALFVLGMMAVGGGGKDAAPAPARYAYELPDYAGANDAADDDATDPSRDPRRTPRGSPVQV